MIRSNKLFLSCVQMEHKLRKNTPFTAPHYPTTSMFIKGIRQITLCYGSNKNADF